MDDETREKIKETVGFVAMVVLLYLFFVAALSY
jgi:hypothetical protein